MPRARSGARILSRLLHFVRSPFTPLPAVEAALSEPPALHPAATLEALIERKRHNDTVRQREFDALRQIRQKAKPGAGERAGDEGTVLRPSFFQTSVSTRSEDRATTVKKINEIEAQMSRLWGATQRSPLGGALLPADAAAPPLHDSDMTTKADFFISEVGVKVHDLPDPQPLSCPPGARPMAVPNGAPPVAAHPAIETASGLRTRLAPADTAAGLRTAVETDAAGAAWRPLWSAVPGLDGPAVADLQRALAAAPQPWVLDWSALLALDAKAARALLGLFSLWADQQVRLHLAGSEVLRQRLQALTPLGCRRTGQLWWELRMAALRLMNLRDEFEQVAQAFAATHDLPPPAWEVPQCETTLLPPVTALAALVPGERRSD